MRKVRLVLGAAALLFTATTFAATSEATSNPKGDIAKQIQAILADNALDVEKDDATARVLFKVNAEGKIEVVKVSSNRKDLTWFLNRKLDNKKIEVADEAIGETFVVNVRVTS